MTNKEIEREVKEKPTHLTADQLREIAASLHKNELEQYKLEILKLKQKTLQLQAKNFELISQLKTYEISTANDSLQKSKNRHTTLMEDIKKEMQIDSPKWGIDFETGEIKS